MARPAGFADLVVGWKWIAYCTIEYLIAVLLKRGRGRGVGNREEKKSGRRDPSPALFFLPISHPLPPPPLCACYAGYVVGVVCDLSVEDYTGADYSKHNEHSAFASIYL